MGAILIIGQLLLTALLYLFLFALMENGIGAVKGQRKKERTWSISVEKGPKELRGVSIPVRGPVVVGRESGADIVIPASFVSGRHARFSLKGQNLFIEDLGSRNGTTVNGTPLAGGPAALRNNDIVYVGDVALRIRYA